MSSILEGADKAYLKEYNESEDERRLGALEDSLGSVRQATKGGKYLGQDVIDIMIQVQTFAEKLGIDPKELDYAEDKVREAQNNLESAIYGLEEPFTDMISALQSRIDDARMDAEDDLEEGQRCWKGYKKKGTKKMFGKTVNNCVKATESEDATRQGKLFTGSERPPEYTTMVPKKIRTPGIYGRSYDGQFKGHALLKSFIENGYTDEQIIELISDIKPGENKSRLTFRRPMRYHGVPGENTETNALSGNELADQVREILPLMRKRIDPLQAWPMGPITKESEEVDEGMYDQDAFDAIFKDRKQPKKSKTTPQDTGMYNQPAKRSPKYYDNHPTKRSPQHYDKGPETDQKLKETPKYIDGFIGADGKPTSQPTAADYAANKEFQHMKKTLGDRLPQPTKRDKDGKLSPFKKDDVDESGITKSSIGKVMEMYDDYLFLIYINGKLAADTPIAKNQKNQYERVIKNAIPDAEVIFKPTPRHYYSAEELKEGSGKIRAGIAGILLLGGLLGLNNHEAQKVYDKSHQLQQLTQVYMVAKDRGDEAKMKDVKRRIGNHKMRLDLGKGDVDFDGLPGDDDIKDIDYINTPGEK